MADPQRIHAWADRLLVLLFACMIGLPPLIALVEPDADFSLQEKRPLARPPEWTLLPRDPRAFIQKLDAYFQDHFGLRGFFIHRYHRETQKRFHVYDSPWVVSGRDGWFFYASEGVLQDLTGHSPLMESALSRLVQRHLALRQALEERAVGYVQVIAPNKQSIYPENMPRPLYLGRGRTRLDQLVLVMKGQDGVRFVDLRPALLAYKQEHPLVRLYNKTDTHWNFHGAYIVYRTLVEALGKEFPGRIRAREADVGYAWRYEPAGDLALMVGEQDRLREFAPLLRFDRQAARVPELDPGLAALLADPPNLRPQLFHAAGQELRILVLHDSFMTTVQPFLAESAAASLFVWAYADGGTMEVLEPERLMRIVEIFRPHVVIDEIVERHIPWLLDDPWAQPPMRDMRP